MKQMLGERRERKHKMTASNFDVADVTVTPDVVIACHDDVVVG